MRAKLILMIGSLMLPIGLWAQSYSMDWYRIGGGGGASTGGVYQVTGTIGQPEASGTMSGGAYSVTGGFWSLIQVVQMPGMPKLTIVPNEPDGVRILWTAAATNSYTLEQNANLATGAWTTAHYGITNSAGTNICTVAPVAGNLFFRLKP